MTALQSINRKIEKSKNARKGFTLIELLVVVGMIALITGAVSTSMSAANQRARIQKATAEVKMITQAILAYENHGVNGLKGKERVRAEAKNAENGIGFLLGGGNSSAGTEIPSLLQAALSAQEGMMRDPWGKPYLVTIRKGSVTSPDLDSLKTGYFLPNFYRLSESERK